MTNISNMKTYSPSNPSSAVIEVRDLSISFAGPQLPDLVSEVSFSVSKGETLCLVGESGCGKSITSLAVMGLLPDTARIKGQALFNGNDLFTMAERAIEDVRGDDVAMIFQEPMTSLNPAYTIGAQIGEAVTRHRGLTGSAMRAEVVAIMRRVGIPAPEKRFGYYPHQMSGGQRQRVMIAMALVNKPHLLIADEPTTALDVTIQSQILQLLKQLQQETGTAVVLITHDLRVVAEVGDRVAVMYAGRVVETGPVQQIFEDPQHPYTVGLFGATPAMGKRAGKLATIEGTVPAQANLTAGCRFAPRCPLASATCATLPPLRAIDHPGHMVSCWHAPIESYALQLAAS
ncbi:ABC transporter ATP-binding protein [Ketogulonicigenium vulgare]|nr:ABC transporter ATP-binding protein [Ketogulonicigenium vulgare]AOZ55000.1 oligopeptide/dipeptide ABC transporter ATPase subunit [Ketogulonicigenium vulgare]